MMIFEVIFPKRHKAKSVNCAANMKQLGVNVVSYAADYNEWLPYYHAAGGQSATVFLTIALQPYYGIKIPINSSTGSGLRPAVLKKFLTCPQEDFALLSAADKAKLSESNWMTGGTPNINTNYVPTVSPYVGTNKSAFSAIYGGFMNGSETACWYTHKRLSRVTDGSILFVEAKVTGIWNSWPAYTFHSTYYKRPEGVNNWNNSSERTYRPHFAHNGESSFMFKDGQVSTYRGGGLFVSKDWVPLK